MFENKTTQSTGKQKARVHRKNGNMYAFTMRGTKRKRRVTKR